jgi:hypothetical protein
MHMTRYCRKPDLICKIMPDLEHLTRPEEIARFVEAEKRSIEQKVSALGLNLVLAGRQDIDAIHQFQASRFPQGTLLEDPYVLFRIVRFGYAPLIKSPDGRIVACNLCEGYDDPDRSLWGIRNSVDPSAAGANLAAELASYSSLIGMERGCRVRRAFVAPGNHASAANIFNHVGFIAESFDLNVPGHHGPRFVLAMPLTPAGVKNNRIDPEKMRRFIDTHQAERDYMIVAASDLDALGRMYSHSPFRVVAFLKAHQGQAENAFLALPEESLGLAS